MTASLTYTGELVVVTCWCGMAHAVPTELNDYQQRTHDDGGNVPSIYCPLGHSHIPAARPRAFVERERREAAERDAANAREEARIARAEVEQLKAAATKARKRANAGVCPDCHRSFVNVARHMATQHSKAEGG